MWSFQLLIGGYHIQINIGTITSYFCKKIKYINLRMRSFSFSVVQNQIIKIQGMCDEKNFN